MDWKPYDPTWLVELSASAASEYPWLPAALAACTKCHEESAAYTCFVDNAHPNEPGSSWQFETNIILEHPTRGELVLDVLRGNRIGGVEIVAEIRP